MSTLKEIRIKKGMSQGALARKSGVTPSEICRLEKGQRKPRLITKDKLTKALGTSLEKIEFVV